MLISFLFPNKNICCGYSLEVPQWGASNEYPQHMFSLRNKKNIMWIPPLICSYGSYAVVDAQHADKNFQQTTFWNIFLIFPENRLWHFMQIVSFEIFPPENELWHFKVIFFLFFPENRLWHFMQIVSKEDNLLEISKSVFWENFGDNLHEMLKPIFWEK